MRNQRIFYRLLLVLVTCGLYTGGALARDPNKPLYVLPSADTPVKLNADTRILQQISDDISAVYDVTKQALVFVSVSKTMRGMPPGYFDPFDFFGLGRQGNQPSMPKQEGVGSGFIIDLENGYVITNNHVIDGADEISLKLANDQNYAAKILGRDPNTDVAVVKIIDPKYDRKGLASLVLGNSDAVRPGALVLALGAPFGLEASASLGIISATSRGNMQITQLGNFLQTDAAVNPGNSGGPLVTTDGKVIAMNTAILSRSGAYNGISLGVPSNLVREVALSLINEGSMSRGFLGVRYRDLDPQWIPNLNLPKGTSGVIVVEVSPGGPADKAGLRASDVIVGINGKLVRDGSELANVIGLTRPGQPAKIEAFREGRRLSFEVVVASVAGTELAQRNPVDDNAGDGAVQKADNPFGLVVTEMKGRKGLLIKAVERGSPAALEGLLPNDRIVAVNGRGDLAANPRVFLNFIRQNVDSVLLLIERDTDDPRNQVRRTDRYLVRLEKKG